MDSQESRLVESLHSARGMASLVIAGAGTRAIGWVLGVAGASRTVLDIQVPYASSAVVDYMGDEPRQFVSAAAARSLARAAYFRAVALRGGSEPVVGVSCTATIATDRPKRGDHRCHVATHHAGGGVSLSLTLDKGRRSRDGEDCVVSRLILNAIAESFGVAERVDLGLTPNESVARDEVEFEDALDALGARHVGHVVVGADGAQEADARIGAGVGVISGSFNPLHRGHEMLAGAASSMLGKPVIYEISITNVDKPPLALGEVRRRIGQIGGRADVAATRATVFYEKARLMPGCAFVIGFDTMERLVDPRYYGGSAGRMASALLEMQGLGCSFLVAGRVADGRFKTLGDVETPPDLRGMFTEIPESAFREDVSSSEIRGVADSRDERG